MAGQQPQAHPEHNQQEYITAAIAGLGLTLAIVAGMFDAFGNSDDILGLEFTILTYIGLVLMAAGLALWMALERPWETFDDLKTPYYTGHHGHDDHTAPSDAADSKSDNLTRIEGIGEAAQAALNDAGITTFAQLANTPPDDLRKALDAADLKSLQPGTWSKQARYIVNGDVMGFDAYKKQLVGGIGEDLTSVEGIGPKTNEALMKSGITTFELLAAASQDQLQKILEDNGLKHLRPDTWSKQAQFVVDGDLEGFEAYKDHLDGGVEPDAK